MSNSGFGSWRTAQKGRAKTEKYSEGLAYTLINGGTAYSVSGIGTCTDTDLNIPPEHDGLPVTEIGYMAFRGNSSIISITLPPNVTSIGNFAFNNCSEITILSMRGISINISSGSFINCSSLSTIYYAGTADDWCNVVGITNLMNVNSLTKYLYINNQLITTAIITTVTNIPSNTFRGCASLTSLIMGNSVTRIDNNAFEHCSGLSNVLFSHTITTIGGYAFRNCNLNTVNLGKNIINIGDFAFNNCRNLINFRIATNIPPSISSGTFINVPFQVIYVPASSVEAYKTASGWSSYASKIQAIPE